MKKDTDYRGSRFWLPAALILGLLLTACGSGAPSAPSGTGTISRVTLNAASVSVGATVQATVALNAAAPAGGLSISASSSNTGVATVQSPVSVPAGALSAVISVTGMASGSATITASVNGSSQTSPSLNVTTGVGLTSLTLSAASVVGGNSVTGIATLNGAAQDGGAVVVLSGGDPVTVAATVTVPAGAASAAFTIGTRAVGGTISATISGSYGGGSASAALAVTAPVTVTVATASFGVTGPSESDTCAMTNNGGTINCTFNGSTSSAPGTITAWDWSYGVSHTFTQTTSQAVLTNPAVDCGLLPAPPLPAGTTWFPLTVTLTIHDSLGNVSSKAINAGARIFPQGSCGF
jgi:hypothetical protein